MRGQDLKTSRTEFYRINCKCWNCCYCAPRKAKKYKRAIRSVAEQCGLTRFVTLTLDPSKIKGDPIRYLNDAFAKLRIYLKRYFGSSPRYIRVLEFQENGSPHFHLLVDRYVPWAWLQEAWQAVGGGLFVNIKFVDVHRISRYLSKYLTKALLLSAPLRSRRVTTSRSIHLFEKQPSETKWEFLRVPILVLYDRHKQRLFSAKLDEDSALESFSINCGEPEPCLEALRVLKAKCGSLEGSGLVFQTGNGTPYSDTNILHRELKPSGQKVGAPWLSWHAFRRTHATLLQAAGGTVKDAQAQLGHAKLSTTLEIYMLPLPAHQREAVENLSRMVTNGDELPKIAEGLPVLTQQIQ